MLRSFAKRDILSIKSFSREELLYILQCAKIITHTSPLLQGYTIGLAFFEPSTRTRLSFHQAAQKLGAHVIGFSSTEGTSLLKGESFTHTLKMIAGYGCNILVVRDARDGAAQYAADVLDIPIINAGDGKHEHPTQTMLDLYAILELFGRLDNLHIGFAGDLKYGRAFRSLQAALSLFSDMRFTYISPPQLKPDKREDMNIRWSDNYTGILSDIDILYVTRIQEERFPDKQEYEKVTRTLQLMPTHLAQAKKTLRILHPLPINSQKFPEIHPDVEDLLVPGTTEKYARYIDQAAYGLPIRMALLALLAGKLGTEIAVSYHIPSFEKKAALQPLSVTHSSCEQNRVLGYIECGTVIDHLRPEAVLPVLDLLSIPQDKLIIFGKNFESKKQGKKGVIKIVDYTPTPDQLNRIAVLSPEATVSYIKQGKVAEKGRVVLSSRIENIMECNNPNCISRAEQKENAPTLFYARTASSFQCHYCDSFISGNDIRLR